LAEKAVRDSIQTCLENKTVIVIAHRFTAIEGADKIILLEKGHIVEQGTWADLIQTKGRFYTYWEQQQNAGYEAQPKQATAKTVSA